MRKAQAASKQQLVFTFEELSGPRIIRESAEALLYRHIPVYGIKLVRTGSLTTQDTTLPKIRSPRDVSNLLTPIFLEADRELFLAILLDTKSGIIGVSIISVGDLSSSIVHPREVMKPAILSNAASIIVAHNHPSGDPNPSPEDIAVTRRLNEASEVLGIDLLDHVIIGGDRWVSLKERGCF